MNIKHFNAYSVPQRKLDVNILTSVTRTFEGNITENVSVPDQDIPIPGQEVHEDSAQMALLVDLGLPSGLKWALGNIVKDDNGNYSIGEETDYGCYFSWGNIDGHNNGEGYDFSSETYATTAGSQVSADIESTDAQHDAALACLGGSWHMPTKEDFKELYDNTDRELTSIDGINGWKFMKKTDHSVYVFFPAAGYGDGTSVDRVGTRGRFWSSSWFSADNAYGMFNGSSVIPQSGSTRYNGLSVRAVQ